MCYFLVDFHGLSAHFALFILIWMSFPSPSCISILAFQQGKIDSLTILDDMRVCQNAQDVLLGHFDTPSYHRRNMVEIMSF